MSSKARRIVNPYTGELLPEGYYMEEHRIVAPDGFAYPRNATTDQEDYWREADAAAAAEAIAAICDDPALYARLSAGAVRTSSRYSATAMMEKYVGLYDRYR